MFLLVFCPPGSLRKRLVGTRDLNSTPNHSPRGLAAKTKVTKAYRRDRRKKTLAREIPPATQAILPGARRTQHGFVLGGRREV